MFLISMALVASGATMPLPRSYMLDPLDAVDTAIRVGLTPGVLAAAGCDDAAAGSILSAIENAANLTSQLSLADEAWVAESPAVAAMADELRGVGGANEVLEAKYLQAAQELADLDASIASLAKQIHQAALAGCPPELADAISRLRASVNAPALPLRVSALAMTGEERDQLAAAYAQKKWAENTGAEIDPKILELVSEVESNPAVIQAQINLDSKLDEVEDLFEGPG